MQQSLGGFHSRGTCEAQTEHRRAGRWKEQASRLQGTANSGGTHQGQSQTDQKREQFRLQRE